MALPAHGIIISKQSNVRWRFMAMFLSRYHQFRLYHRVEKMAWGNSVLPTEHFFVNAYNLMGESDFC
ncbi:hypothetical protein CKO_03486 [Citrobacter koseri ATCC BAA-895]|uniref:Uncharacterized protein n=1 Tax=Citrobacter koseri (strain ATCC BAA-895 / CDC 4225-83 / SGSC4696) TaxID=290338 RepID=A8AM53_CITK8|nr:hypothetical protein CKO_03486 [Citrobacter koseri ATCC BAA-895]